MHIALCLNENETIKQFIENIIQSEQRIARFTSPMITKHDKFLGRHYSDLFEKE